MIQVILFIISLQVNKESDNVRVVVRCRPMNDKEKEMNCKMVVKIDEVTGSLKVENPDARSGQPPKTFTFDRVFSPGCKQTDVYNDRCCKAYRGKCS